VEKAEPVFKEKDTERAEELKREKESKGSRP
jgi:hypothetical protein